MNNRIKQLLEEAGFDVETLSQPYPGGFPREDMVCLDSFAKLIIKECTNLLEKKAVQYDRSPGHEISAQTMETVVSIINNHFGIE